MCRILTQLPAPKSNETLFAVQNRLTGRFCFLVDTTERNSMKLQLLTKPQCHLCAAARQTMDDVTAQYGIGWQEISTTDHPDLAEQFAEEIPVLFVDERQRDFWVIDANRLARMIEAGLDA